MMMRLIYFSPVPARSYAQRPHFTVQAWLARGVREVLWVDPYPVRLPRWRDLPSALGARDQQEPLPAGVTVLDVASLPIEPLPGGTWLNRRWLWSAAWQRLEQFAAEGPMVLGIGRPSALALTALRELRPAASFYEALDDFPEFYGGLSRRSVRRHEDSLAAESELVVTSSSTLAAKFARRGLTVVHVPNAYGMSSLPPWAPASLRQPVLGFIGCLGAWIDWPLLVRLANQLPYVTIELVGPPMAAIPRRLPANLHLLGHCRRQDAAGHLARFSAGLVPFRRIPLTASVDPIKFYECRAFGLPVLSTTFGEMARRGPAEAVFFMDQGESLPTVVARALNHTDDAATVARFRHENDWSRRYADADPFGGLFARSRSRRAA